MDLILLRIGQQQQDLTSSQILMFFAAIVYVLLVSYFGTKHNTQQERITRIKLHQSLGKATLEQVNQVEEKVEESKKKIKTMAVLTMGIIGVIHISIVSIWDEQNTLYPNICLIAFLLIMLTVFWLKGATTLYGGSSKQFRGFH